MQKYNACPLLLVLDVCVRVINISITHSSPPKYWRNVGNAYKVPPQKKGKFQPHLLVVDRHHPRTANAALETE
jgi:hypothetical protein